MQVLWCDKKIRISLQIMKQCYWNLAGTLHPTKYNRWYTFWCCYSNMLVSSLLPLQNGIRITICDSTRQKTWSYLKHMPVPPSLGLLLKIFNYRFCPVQLQMVTFDFEKEETGTKHVAMATSKCVPSGIFHRVQHPCQVSIALLHYWRRYP